MPSWQEWTSGSLETLTHPDWIQLFTKHDSICRWSTTFHLAAQNARDVGQSLLSSKTLKPTSLISLWRALTRWQYIKANILALPDKAMLQERTEDPITLQERKEESIQQFIFTRNVPEGEEEEYSCSGSCCKDCFCNGYFIQIPKTTFVRSFSSRTHVSLARRNWVKSCFVATMASCPKDETLKHLICQN